MADKVYLGQQGYRWGGLGNPLRDQAACGVGLLVNLAAQPCHRVVEDALVLLSHLDHRGARGAEEGTGDGTGILLQKPHLFFQSVIPDIGDPAEYAVGQVFFPQDAALRGALIGLIERTASERHFEIFCWRDVPTADCKLGRTSGESEPFTVQFFVRPVMPSAPPQFASDL